MSTFFNNMLQKWLTNNYAYLCLHLQNSPVAQCFAYIKEYNTICINIIIQTNSKIQICMYVEQ